jgi:16S rRNA (cytosine1402-N4)-methyltransferase
MKMLFGKLSEGNETYHIPVMVEEVMNFLNPCSPYTYLDCTLGTGGHSLEILKRSSPNGKVIGIDKDEESIEIALKRLKEFEGRFKVFCSDYREIFELPIDFGEIKGVLIDLGLSLYQLQKPERGFSFNIDGPLDMRFSKKTELTAEKVLNRYRRDELIRIFREFGEVKSPQRLVDRIVEMRKKKPFKRTSELKELIEKIYRWRPIKGKTHPAQKIFQAIRIEVNNELKGLDLFLEKLLMNLKPQSKVVVISFHSLEDRIVKNTFKKLEKEGIGEILTKKPLTPSLKEIEMNPSSRSSKLRCIRRR